jgi:hypothetical protein
MLQRINPIPRHARVKGQGKGQSLFTGLGRLVRIKNTSRRNKIPAISRNILAAVLMWWPPNLLLAGDDVGVMIGQEISDCQYVNG